MKTILVIEDDRTLREFLQDLLQQEGYQVLLAANGYQGIQLARDHLPDLILCDILMPDIDGYEVLTTLHKNLVTATIPFLFLTARSSRSELRHGMDLGADDYITKPCRSEDLLRAITSRLEKRMIAQSQSQQQLDNLRSSIALSLPHELRTPLTGILTAVEVLRVIANTAKPSEILSLADNIQASAERLYKLVERFLFYAQIELTARDPEKLKLSQMNHLSLPGVAITETARQVARKAERESDLEISVIDDWIQMGLFEFEKLIEELVDNALKFSNPGTPVQIQSFMDERGYILEITNQGQGMTPEQIANIGAYLQFDRKAHEQQGMGLGLAIAQRLLELHSSRLEIESVPNEFIRVRAILALYSNSPAFPD